MPSCGVRVGASSEYNSVERSDAYTSYLSCVVSCLKNRSLLGKKWLVEGRINSIVLC